MRKLYYASIFNDVIGPIMTGPSSSHTAGCARIGYMTRILYGKEIQKAEILFDKKSSYASTYQGQGSDYGFTGGLMGFLPEDLRLKDAVNLAKEKGIAIQFMIGDTNAKHPNEARITIYNQWDQPEMTVLTCSTGGGMFEITELDGFPVSIKGDCEKVLIACKKGTVTERLLKKYKEFSILEKGKEILYYGTIPIILQNCLREKCNGIEGISFFRVAKVILPVARKQGPGIFQNAKEAEAYQKKTEMDLWDLAIQYECSVGDITKDAVWSNMMQILKVMRESMIILQKPIKTTGFLEPRAQEMAQTFKKRSIADVGFLQQVLVKAVAVMENNCAHGIVAAAPTAGSCGVLPSAVVALGEAMEKSDDEIIKALFASGLVGAFIANQATFGAEVAGCQAENGAASAMAAAGIVQLLGGSTKEAFFAASLALQNLLGLICDPVGGLTEIPCIGRNVAAAGNAVLSANMVLGGFDPVIPLDEVIITMYQVGKLLPGALRCTCEGGLCQTPTAKTIVRDFTHKIIAFPTLQKD